MSAWKSIVTGVCGLALVAGAAVAAENLVKGGDGEDAALTAKWHPRMKQNLEIKKSGQASMEVSMRDWVLSPDLIEIDPAKTYRLTGSFRSVDGKPVEALFGLRYYSVDKKEIGPVSAMPVPGTDATLVADAKKEDATILVTGAWTLKPPFLYGVAFNIKEDLSDLPNATALVITKAEARGANCLITLWEPLTADYPAGTKVRMQRYVDYVVDNITATGEWKEQTMTVSGEAPRGMPSKDKFWNGTRYIRVHAAFNTDRKPENYTKVLMDDVSVVEVAK